MSGGVGVGNAFIPIARILKGLAEASQFQRNGDSKLRNAIGSVLLEIGADALICRVGLDGIVLGAFDYSLQKTRRDKDRYIKGVAELADARARKGIIYDALDERDTGIEHLFIFPRFEYTTEWGKSVHPSSPEVFCFVSGLRRNEDGSAYHSKRWQKITRSPENRLQLNDRYRDVVESYCRAIQIAILRRAETDSIFSPSLSIKFWNLVDDQYPMRMRIRPWDEEPPGESHQIPTATLSFDLRRSTFIMEHAIDKKAHADWLESLVIVLKQILHRHEGVFDKFTGDGVLAHFPIFEFNVESKDDGEDAAVLNCVSCGWDMIRAAEMCGRFLIPNLTLSNEKFGAAVGGAFDFAQWSVDRAGNPIVVGRGVVHACRLSGGEPGTVQLSNAIMARMKRLLADGMECEEADFVSKEYKEGSGVKLFRMRAPPMGLGMDSRALRTLVDTVFVRSRRSYAHQRSPH